MRSPAVQAKLLQIGLTPKPQTRAEFDGFVRDEIRKWAVVVKQSGAKVD